LLDKKLMLTRSKCMAASEAAGKNNWEMERISDTFHPPTTVVATPDPILAQSEPPPNPTHLWQHDKHLRRKYVDKSVSAPERLSRLQDQGPQFFSAGEGGGGGDGIWCELKICMFCNAGLILLRHSVHNLCFSVCISAGLPIVFFELVC